MVERKAIKGNGNNKKSGKKVQELENGQRKIMMRWAT